MYVFSTLSSSIEFEAQGRKIVIRGGANVFDKKHLWTPKGVSTKVSKEELDALRKIASFQKKEKDGYFSVARIEHNADKMAKDMAGADKSAQKEIGEKETKAKRRA